MKVEEYRIWLLEKGIYKTPRLVKDCISRTKRVEMAFQAVSPQFSLDNEFEKDKGVSFSKYLSRRGIDIKENVDLPLKNNQMDSIVAATKKYFLFLSEARASHSEKE